MRSTNTYHTNASCDHCAIADASEESNAHSEWERKGKAEGDHQDGTTGCREEQYELSSVSIANHSPGIGGEESADHEGSGQDAGISARRFMGKAWNQVHRHESRIRKGAHQQVHHGENGAAERQGAHCVRTQRFARLLGDLGHRLADSGNGRSMAGIVPLASWFGYGVGELVVIASSCGTIIDDFGNGRVLAMVFHALHVLHVLLPTCNTLLRYMKQKANEMKSDLILWSLADELMRLLNVGKCE